jgi:small nuclear ribonucleoprotein (snRNP)-like protein
MPPPPADTPALAAVRALFGAAVRLTLADARTLTGLLYCVDWKGNVVLRDAELTRADAPGAPPRAYGVVAVPLAVVARAEADAARWVAPAAAA